MRVSGTSSGIPEHPTRCAKSRRNGRVTAPQYVTGEAASTSPAAWFQVLPRLRQRDFLRWLGYERDAAWATKLAILRLDRLEDIERFGAFLTEHQDHAAELALLLRATDPRCEIPDEPPFITRDAHVIGGIVDPDKVIAATRTLEVSRIARYEERPRRGRDEPHRVLDAVLERHVADARLRLAWLTGQRSSTFPAASAAA
ncbi:MAG TPA: hypothetical protein VF765_30165 [Polyangiaceae bacterium]